MERLKMIIQDIINEMGVKEFTKLINSFKYKKPVCKVDKDITYDSRFDILLSIVCTRHYSSVSVVKANFKELVFEKGFDINKFDYSDGNVLVHGIQSGCNYNLVILTYLFVMVTESFCEAENIKPSEYLSNMMDIDKIMIRKKLLFGNIKYMLGIEPLPFYFECKNAYLITLSILMSMKTKDIKEVLVEKYEEYLIENKIIKKPIIKGGKLNV